MEEQTEIDVLSSSDFEAGIDKVINNHQIKVMRELKDEFYLQLNKELLRRGINFCYVTITRFEKYCLFEPEIS